MGWPITLGCWHISQPRRRLVVQGMSASVRGHSVCCRTLWQICCRSGQPQWQPGHHSNSFCFFFGLQGSCPPSARWQRYRTNLTCARTTAQKQCVQAISPWQAIPERGEQKRFGAMTTSRGSKAGHDTSVSTESCRKIFMCMQYVCPSIRISSTGSALWPAKLPSQAISSKRIIPEHGGP